MSYGESNAWAKFIAAYNAHCIVYCRASSNSNPATGSQTRKAFMAYVNNETSPTSVEFQYYRSVSSHSDSQQGDQVFVYTLTNSNGGTWSVTSRNTFSKVVAGTNMTSSYSSGTLTLNATQPTVPTKTSDLTNDSGFITSADLPTKTSDLTNDGSDGSSTYVEADELATVATTGSYDDLSNKPTIPAAQVQSDWTQTTTTAVDYIKNKPTLATVATSGSYNDLSDTPTIPTVNDATLTIQKNGTDVQTFTANQSTNATANIIVPTQFSDLSGTVGTSQIADGAVTNAKLGASALALFPKKTLLASGGSKTTTTTNLSQAPSNFDFLLVDIVSGDAARQCITIPATATLFDASDSFYWGGVIYFKTTQWTISGSTITRNASCQYSSEWGTISSGDNHGIVNVYGIKY
jgi:hypothetical protein